MKIDVLARMWGSPTGAANGMAIAVAYFAETLERLGHSVRRSEKPIDHGADLIITTISTTWRRAVVKAVEQGARDRLVYWHHAGGVQEGFGCTLAAPPAVLPADPTKGWAREVTLPPSSWSAEAGGECTGSEVLVAGAGAAKGGLVALEVARLCPDLRWLVLRSRSSAQDRNAWRALPNAEVADDVMPPEQFFARARVVLSPTRFEVHPLLLVEAAARGIPIVCSDMAATRAAAPCSWFVETQAPPEVWAVALRRALSQPAPRLTLRPYADVVADAIDQLVQRRAAA